VEWSGDVGQPRRARASHHLMTSVMETSPPMRRMVSVKRGASCPRLSSRLT
jgi:hypothetical protein